MENIVTIVNFTCIPLVDIQTLRKRNYCQHSTVQQGEASLVYLQTLGQDSDGVSVSLNAA